MVFLVLLVFFIFLVLLVLLSFEGILQNVGADGSGCSGSQAAYQASAGFVRSPGTCATADERCAEAALIRSAGAAGAAGAAGILLLVGRRAVGCALMLWRVR